MGGELGRGAWRGRWLLLLNLLLPLYFVLAVPSRLTRRRAPRQKNTTGGGCCPACPLFCGARPPLWFVHPNSNRAPVDLIFVWVGSFTVVSTLRENTHFHFDLGQVCGYVEVFRVFFAGEKVCCWGGCPSCSRGFLTRKTLEFSILACRHLSGLDKAEITAVWNFCEMKTKTS